MMVHIFGALKSPIDGIFFVNSSQKEKDTQRVSFSFWSCYARIRLRSVRRRRTESGSVLPKVNLWIFDKLLQTTVKCVIIKPGKQSKFTLEYICIRK